jgi:hypothetical protein
MTEREILDMLRGSPTGTTEAMFASHGATRAQLDRLVAAGKARVEIKTLDKPRIDVPWFYLVGEKP